VDKSWHRALVLASKRRNTKKDALKFAELIDAIDLVDETTAASLLKTFGPEPDYGTQEEVIGVLNEAPAEVRALAILNELPRLLDESAEWAYELVGHELRHNPAVFMKLALKVPASVRAAILQLHEDAEFADRCTEAKRLAQLFA
jgi:hypothetical protein